jgi:hypothetical protein
VTGRVAVGHSLTFISVTHVTVVIHHKGWLQGISTLITKVTLCCWIMNVCQQDRVMFVLPNHCCHITTFLAFVTLFNFHCLSLKLCGISLHFGLTVLQQLILRFVRLLYSVNSENKKNCPYITSGYVPFLFFSGFSL